MYIYELIGLIFGLISVYLSMRNSAWCWPIGMVSLLAFAIVFFNSKLYIDMLLQIFFFVTSIQGWYYWRNGGAGRSELPITLLTHRQITALAIGLVAAVALVGWLFASTTDAHLPFWDAAASGTSVLAQLLLIRRKLETWYLWIVVNILSVGIYFYKQLYLTTGLYLIFLFLAIGGLLAWRRELGLGSTRTLSA